MKSAVNIKASDWYKSLLQDQRWYDRRFEIIKRDGFRCTKCGLNDELQVHHIKYIQGLMPWEYTDNLLMTLCRGCHGRIGNVITGEVSTVSDVLKMTIESLRV